MKILFANEKCGYFGGVEQNVAEAADALRGRGHECYLAYREVTGRQVPDYQSLFSQTYPCHGDVDFDSVLRQVEPDTIYLHKWAMPSGTPVGARMVRMVHDHDLCCPRRHKYYAWNGRVCNHKADFRCYLDAAFLERSNGSFHLVSIARKISEMRRNQTLDRLLVGSRSMREELLQNGFPVNRVSILAPVVRLPDRPRTELPDTKSILYVGQLIHGKGVDLLLRALARIKTPFTAAIVGTGNAAEKLKALSGELGLNDRVTFAGWVSPREIGRYYERARVVAVPSRWPEPFGMIGLEAMNYARPVVGFDAGGIPDWLEHEVTGLLAPQQDVAAFAAALERVLEQDDFAIALSRRAYEQVRARFSFESYLDQLEAHLANAV